MSSPPLLTSGRWLSSYKAKQLCKDHKAVGEWCAEPLNDVQSHPWLWVMDHGGEPGFVLIYHQRTAEVGFWLTPKLRGQGLGAKALSDAITRFGQDKNIMFLASLPEENTAAALTCERAGFRIMARQPGRLVFVFYREDAMGNSSALRTTTL